MMMYNLRTRESDQLKTILEFYVHGNSSKDVDAQLSDVEDDGEKKHRLRLRNFDARNERIETGAVVKSHR